MSLLVLTRVLLLLPPAGKKHLESAVLHCLCLLDLTLQKEMTFMNLLRESQASMLVSPLEQLLQGVNPQTKRADHIVNIARYEPPAAVKWNSGFFQRITFNAWL